MNPGVVLGLVVLAGVGAVSVWASGARAAWATARRVRVVVCAGRVALNTVLGAVVIVAVQWALLTHTSAPTIWALVLGAPGLLAGASAARLVAVTTAVPTRRRVRR